MDSILVFFDFRHMKTRLPPQHPNSKEFLLMNPVHVISIDLLYLSVVFLLHHLMKHREKFQLRFFALIHNAFLVLLSAYMFIGTVSEAINSNFSLWGNGIVSGEAGQTMARILWIFYASKILEFIDTILIVLKKNDSQLSFLHIYHHSTIFAIWWAVIYFAPGGESYFSAAQNSFVHVLMYSYYLLSSLGITVPWKPWITWLQMLQFFLNLLQSTHMLLFPHPKFPLFLAKILFVYMISLLILFGNFIRQGKNQNVRKKHQERKNNTNDRENADNAGTQKKLR
jgi:hypothetical protein